MSPRLRQMLAALPARQLNLILTGVVLIAAMLAWSAGLRAPLAAYRQQGAALAALQAAARKGPPAAALPDAAQPPAAAPAPAPQPLELIAAVSRSAGRHGVTVSSAAQGPQLKLAGLRAQTLDIAAGGSYGALMAWLAEIQAGQPAIGIVGFELQPGTAGVRAIRLQLAIYDAGTVP